MRYLAIFLLMFAVVFAQEKRENGATNVITYFNLRDTDGTVLNADPNDFDLYYVEEGAALSTKVDATGVDDNSSAAHSDNTVSKMSETLGLYRVDWPDAAFDGGTGKTVQLILLYATGYTETIEVELSPPVNAVLVNGETPDTSADIADDVLDELITDHDDTAWTVGWTLRYLFTLLQAMTGR